MPDTFQPTAADMQYAAAYLQSFGYIEPPPAGVPRAPSAPSAPPTDALAEFQEFAGLPVTSELDKATLDKMDQPRCGVRDVRRLGDPRPARWQKRHLKFFIKSFVGGISQAAQRVRIANKFIAWANVANITFEAVTQEGGADIIISTGRGAAAGFDGPGKVLAFAYLPTGDDRPLPMFYDLDENWEPIFDATSLHEFGHLLGLDHSRDNDDIMAPFLNASFTVPRRGDIARIQAMYGPPLGGDPPPTDPTCKTVNDCLKTLRNALASIQRGREFTLAGTTIHQEFSQLVQRVGELPCDKIGPLITAVAAAFAACQPQPAALSIPCLGGGLPCAKPAATNPCAALTGLLAICSQLGPILKACPVAPASVPVEESSVEHTGAYGK